METIDNLFNEILKLRSERRTALTDYEKVAQTYLNGKIDGMEKAFEILVGCSIGQYVYENEWRV